MFFDRIAILIYIKKIVFATMSRRWRINLSCNICFAWEGGAVRDTQAALGIDLGTSQLKALLTTLDGQVLGRGRAAYPVRVPAEGQAESDPENWWSATVTAVREALADCAARGSASGDQGRDVRIEVTGLAIAGQMHGVVLAGADGTPSRPAIVWLDRRAAAEAARYDRLPREITEPLGNAASPGMAGPILSWLSRHEPETMEHARWALQPKDWLRLRLTGLPATDPTDASGTLLFSLPRRTWARDVIEALELPMDKLPDIREPAEIAGHLLPARAADLSLKPGIPVATGAADTAAALHAAALADDEVMLTLGTGGQWIAPETRFRPAARTNLFRAIDGYYRLAAAQNVGATLDWVRTLFGVSWQELYDTAARPWRPDTPVFLPYLTAERWDGAARGGWADLTLAHGKDDLLRAALEGVAFLLRERLEDLRAAGHRPASVVIGGGGTGHPAWRQLLADVLGLPLRPAPTTWLSPTGAAAIATAGTGAAATGAPAAASGMAAGGVSRVRSEYGKAEVVAPGEQSAASAAYGRFVILASQFAHKLGVPELALSRHDGRKRRLG
jgi:xylulokinase